MPLPTIYVLILWFHEVLLDLRFVWLDIYNIYIDKMMYLIVLEGVDIRLSFLYY
jgi:hypothetical protein